MAKQSISDINWTTPLPGVSLDMAGLLLLAPLTPILQRTAILGSANFLDALVLCPGIHRQQQASDLNKGEYPATAALTTGYIFRIENQATVAYLQKVGITGQLVTLSVEKLQTGPWRSIWINLFGPTDSVLSLVLVTFAMLSTVTSMAVLSLLKDWWGISILLMLITARLLNIHLIRRRARPSWHGKSEPGATGDLLVLLSQDRWTRIQGPVDALKAVTSGQWLRDMTVLENSLDGCATVLIYVSAILAGNATQIGQMVLMVLLLVSAGVLGISNALTEGLNMHGHFVRPKGKPKVYARRLDLGEELIKETGRHDWAVGLGMVKAEDYGEKLASVVTL